MFIDTGCFIQEIYHQDGSHYYQIVGDCLLCKKTHVVEVPAKGLFQYRQGTLLQDAFPSVSPEDRDFVHMGICPKCNP